MSVVTMMPTLAELVDQLGAVEAELNTPAVAQMKAQEKRATALRKLIADRVTAAADQPATVKGQKYTAVVGMRENQTKIVSMSRVWARVKQRVFFANCTLTLKALEQMIPDSEERAQLLKTERTGSRPVTTFPIESGEGMQKAA